MKLVLLALSLVSLLVSPVRAEEEGAPPHDGTVRQDFEAPDGGTPFVFRRGSKVGGEPTLADGRVQLLFGRSEHQTSIAFPRTAAGPHRHVEATFRLTLEGQVEGAAFALLHVGQFGVEGAAWDPQPPRRTDPESLKPPPWEEPSLRDSLAVGFDVRDPVDEDWFNESGNFEGRPERQVSLHWDGREVANAVVKTELVAGQPVDCRVVVDHVTGGAEVTVEIAGERVHDRRFVPHVLPYESRAAFGAHGKGEVFLDDVAVDWAAPAAPTPAPLVVPAVRGAWLRPGLARHVEKVDLPPPGFDAERVIMTLVYRGPQRRDYWDRSATVRVLDEEGVGHELARVITPFMRWGLEYRYDVDVSLVRPLLFGRRSLEVQVGSAVAEGFLVDVTLTYYRRPEDVPAQARALALRKLWDGQAPYADAEALAAFFDERRVRIPRGADGALVRVMVTGHGVMEFTPVSRWLTVNGREHESRLWRADCWLNPYRQQFGTWKFDRAGWCPGAVTEPWLVDVGDLLEGRRELVLDYRPEPADVEGWAEHWIEADVIFLADPPRSHRRRAR